MFYGSVNAHVMEDKMGWMRKPPEADIMWKIAWISGA
jgi:hypothetical protein